MALQARLKPYDKDKGHVLRGITITELGGMAFDEGKLVGPIDEHAAGVLRTIRQRHGDANSPLAFDVLDEGDMKRLVAAEARTKLGLTPEVVAALRDNLDAEAQPTPVAEAAKPARRTRVPA